MPRRGEGGGGAGNLCVSINRSRVSYSPREGYTPASPLASTLGEQRAHRPKHHWPAASFSVFSGDFFSLDFLTSAPLIVSGWCDWNKRLVRIHCQVAKGLTKQNKEETPQKKPPACGETDRHIGGRKWLYTTAKNGAMYAQRAASRLRLRLALRHEQL